MARHKVFTRTRLSRGSHRASTCIIRASSTGSSTGSWVSQPGVAVIGVVGAYEHAYATADVLATEAAIAATIGQLADRAGPHIDPASLDGAMRAAEERLGRALTTGQVVAVQAVCD